jgi:replication-associated recombination protein RarA
MQWQCLKGLAGEVRKINVEFNEARGLKPITDYISGPPGAGKTYYSKQLAEHYNVPRIDTASVVAKDLDLVPVSNQRAAQLLHGTSVTILFFDHQNLQVDHTIPPLES